MNNIIKKIFLFILLISFVAANANETAATPTEILLPSVEVDGERIPYAYLPEVFIFPELVFKNKKQEEFYWKTVRDVKKTLPYAKIAGKIMTETDEHLKTIPTDKERKAYMKSKEKELFAQFEGDLKKMTVSQGKMLIRLIDRECDKTTYEIIKEYRGGVSAVFWQGIAKIFGSNLKAEYDGKDKDQIVERVIILVEAGEL